MNVSRGSIDAAVVVLRAGNPALIADVAAGRRSLFEAARSLRRTKLDVVPDGGVKAVEHVV